MSLIKCLECGNEISDKAPTCPHCGVVLTTVPTAETNPWKRKLSPIEIIGTIALTLIIGGWLIHLDRTSPKNEPKQSTETVQPAPEQPAPTPAAPQALEMPPKPTHFYSMQDGDNFGYQPALSQNDINEGLASKPLVMFKLMSKTDEKIVLRSEEGRGAFTVISCALPCDFAKVVTVNGFGASQVQTMPVAGGSIMSMAIQDAMNGFMDEPLPDKPQADNASQPSENVN